MRIHILMQHINAPTLGDYRASVKPVSWILRMSELTLLLDSIAEGN